MKIFVILDVPLKNCDKEWLYKGLIDKGFSVMSVEAPFVLWDIARKNGIGKLLAKIIQLFQVLKVYKISKSDDIILCWTASSGTIAHCIKRYLHIQRKIVSMCWLTPSGKVNLRHKRAFSDPNFIATVNEKENIERIREHLGIKKEIHNMVYVPDVYDDNVNFVTPIPTKRKYYFAGGVSNRDWDNFLELVINNSKIHFVVVTMKREWGERRVPSNLSVYFDLPAKEYYSLMLNSYAAIFLLRENRVSGLVNILRAFQAGIVCISTDLSCTRKYYPSNCYDMLCKLRDYKSIESTFQVVDNYTVEQYIKKVNDLQNYIKKNYSPKNAIDKLEEIICNI